MWTLRPREYEYDDTARTVWKFGAIRIIQDLIDLTDLIDLIDMIDLELAIGRSL